jgi:signal transduction histidine kinase
MQEPVNRAIYPFPDEKSIIQAYYKNSGLAWVASNFDGVILLANLNFYEMSGYTQDELCGESLKNILHEDEYQKFDQILSDRAATGHNGEMRLITKNSTDHLIFYKTIIFIEGVNIPYFVWYFNYWGTIDQIINEPRGDQSLLKSSLKNIVDTETNMTGNEVNEKSKIEHDIYEKSKILNGVVNNLPVIIFKIDETGDFILLQGNSSRIEKFKKSRTAKLSIKVALKQARKKLQQSTISDDYFSFTSNYVSTLSEWHFENFMFKEPNDDNTYAGFSIDITDRKNAEHEMKRHTKSLQKINKELDQFAYVVSHDLKAPLRAITNLSEWIEEDMGEDVGPDIKNNFRLLRGRVHRLQALVDGILEYSRIGRMHVQTEQVDTDKLFTDLIENLGVSGNFKIIKKNKLPLITVNKLRLEQVFMNLISNAIKYHDKKTGTVEIDYEKINQYHQFSVTDDGPGIAPEYHEKIFMIFQILQPRDAIESTGVGLSIVKKIIEEQGGRVWIESELGKGAKFVFNIPENNG